MRNHDPMKRNLLTEEIKKHDAGLCEMLLQVTQNAQRAKLEKARNNGRKGWETASVSQLEKLLVKAHEDEDWASVANYASMLYIHSLEDR